jgi:chemotaxis protein histidine kinase CheA
VAHALEDVLGALRDQRLTADPRLVDELLRIVDQLRRLIDQRPDCSEGVEVMIAGLRRLLPARDAAPAVSDSVGIPEAGFSPRAESRLSVDSPPHEVETAADGKEGLRKLQSGNFELVVTDIEFDHRGMLPRLVMPCRRPAEPATLRLV